ncbi:MAG: hypothetical protein ACRDDZ_09525 [Marinifilaceae bacterium]
MLITNKYFKKSLVGMALGASLISCDNAPKEVYVHAVTDLSHEFSFYADHRFHSQYIKDGKGQTNWTSLFNYDFSNANLLVLLGCDDRISYLDKDVDVITNFVNDGGGIVLLGNEQTKSQNELAKKFGVSFAGQAAKPYSTPSGEDVVGGYASVLDFGKNANKWDVLVADKDGKPILARSKYGKGNLLVGARSIAGSNPNASDSINHTLWRPLLKQIASGKEVDPNKPFHGRGIGQLEYKDNHDTFILSYNDYMKPYAASMVDISKRCMPFIEKRMGVPLSKGMGSEISLLATGGGGFSSGSVIALAVWWGDFPNREDSMIEFITHESVHSWVLPHPEIWNEPIATYVGNLVMCDMGHEEEGRRRIQHTIERAMQHDPNMTDYDIAGNSLNGKAKLEGGAANDVHWGKSYWVLEELGKQYPNFIANYFKTKRKLLEQQTITRYDENNTVAIMSAAVGKDLFPWFKKHGFNVDKKKAEVKI